jgi:hypothetical protein
MYGDYVHDIREGRRADEDGEKKIPAKPDRKKQNTKDLDCEGEPNFTTTHTDIKTTNSNVVKFGTVGAQLTIRMYLVPDSILVPFMVALLIDPCTASSNWLIYVHIVILDIAHAEILDQVKRTIEIDRIKAMQITERDCIVSLL